MKQKLGIVLAGGGGNGAYQLGVWKYLCEVGLSKRIAVMSGTSVGALNVALFATVPYEQAEHIWKHLIQDKILFPQASTPSALSEAVLALTDGSVETLRKSASELLSSGVWSREGLLEIMRDIPLEKLASNTVPKVYATCFALMPMFGTRHFILNGFDVQKIQRILLATSAIPLVFRPEKVDNILYCDGGISCNVPISPLVRENCTHALVVHLSQEKKVFSRIPSTMRVEELYPSVPLAKRGVLDFSTERIENLIHLGYDDCKRAFSGRLSYFIL